MIKPAHENAALRGLRVLELTDALGQYAGKLLADMGADVIKIEPPEGSTIRRVGPFEADEPGVNRSLTFWHYNTSKRGVTLDIETADGRELFRRLVATADVIIESFRPGYLDSLGVGFEDLRQDNRKLIMCSITPFGQFGPWRDYLSSDMIHMALGGTMASTGYSEPGSPPIAPTGGNAYHTACHFAVSAILVAALEARWTGQGQYIDQAVHDAAAMTTEGALHAYVYEGKIVHRNTGQHHTTGPTPRWNFPTKDGRMVNLLNVMVTPERWRQLVAWMDQTGHAEDLTSEKFADPAMFVKEAAYVAEVTGRFVSTLTAKEVFEGAQKIRLTWSPIRAIEEIPEQDHVQLRGLLHKVEHPESGRSYEYLGTPIKFSRSHWEIRGRAPLLGEHNGEVFVEELGIDPGALGAVAATSL